MRIAALALLGVLVGCGCSDGAATSDQRVAPRDGARDAAADQGPVDGAADADAGPRDDTIEDTSYDSFDDSSADSLPSDGLVVADAAASGARLYTLKACGGVAPGSEDCHFRVLIDAATCSAQAPCDKLVIYWSGGEGFCYLGTYDGLLARYAQAGYVAVCAQPFTTSGETGKYPYYRELDRMSELLRRVRALPEVAAAWSGDKLLISGVSHGGTAPLLGIASGQALKAQPALWLGRTRTALVFYDGLSNLGSYEAWTAQSQSCAAMHRRTVARYGDGTPLSHGCSNGKCYCASPPHQAEWNKDNVQLGSSGSPYSCADVTAAASAAQPSLLYRFVACSGGSAQPCGILGDVIPDAQQQGAFDAIKTCAGVTATYERYPLCPHTLCGSKGCGFDDTIAWLTQQGF
ncbi:MAG: hypothetical protein KC503_08975 [Myxococcales bacterium]|nr:hypothetical protein [Myxococcales bacterium]